MIQNRKIKILFRHRSMEMGGVEKVLLNVINNLDRNQFELTVCLNLDQGELRNEIPSHVRKVALTKGKEDMSKISWVQKIQLFARQLKLNYLQKHPKIIDEKYLKEHYDIEVGMTYNDFDWVLNSSNKKSKKVGWFHSEIILPKLQPLVPKILDNFPRFDAMIYCSKRIKELMHTHYANLKYPKEKVIINAIPLEEIKEKSQQKITDFPHTTHPVFVSIGRLHTRKGYHLLMQAHARLLSRGLQHEIVILGDGEELDNLALQRKELGVEKTFHLLGNKMNPYPYLKQADFFIMPSESEAWPLVLAEALLLQKPSIATNTGDVATMLKDNETGLLVSYSSDELENAMEIFLTQPHFIKKLKQNLTTIEKQFDNQKIYKEIENIFTNLINEKI